MNFSPYILTSHQITHSLKKKSDCCFHILSCFPLFLFNHHSWTTFATSSTKPLPKANPKFSIRFRKKPETSSRNTWSDRHGSNQHLSASPSKSKTRARCRDQWRWRKDSTLRVFELPKINNFIYLSIYVSVYLSICLSVNLSYFL